MSRFFYFLFFYLVIFSHHNLFFYMTITSPQYMIIFKNEVYLSDDLTIDKN